jgi:hypothetical protein
MCCSNIYFNLVHVPVTFTYYHWMKLRDEPLFQGFHDDPVPSDWPTSEVCGCQVFIWAKGRQPCYLLSACMRARPGRSPLIQVGTPRMKTVMFPKQARSLSKSSFFGHVYTISWRESVLRRSSRYKYRSLADEVHKTGKTERKEEAAGAQGLLMFNDAAEPMLGQLKLGSMKITLWVGVRTSSRRPAMTSKL